MGNSPQKVKQKKRPKRNESKSQSGDEEEEYEEVEESYLEEVESELTPKNSNNSKIPKLQPPLSTPKSPTFNSPRKQVSQYERWKKPIRNSVMFARHYFMSLQKIEVSVGMQDEKYWLMNLESVPEETSFRLSNQQPWRPTPSDKGLQEIFPEWNSAMPSQPQLAHPSFQDGGDFNLGRPETKPRSNMQSIPTNYETRPSEIGLPPKRESQDRQKGQNPYDQWEKKNSITKTGQAGEYLPYQYEGQPDERDRSRFNYDNQTQDQFVGAPGLNNRGKNLPRQVNTDQYYEEVQQSNRDQEGNYNENTFIKTTYNQSEANSEDQGKRDPPYCEEQNPCFQENCPECIEMMNRNAEIGNINGTQSNQFNSRNMRDIRIEVDREAMYERYLENLVANKPSKVQKLLVEQYYRPRSNERDQGTVNNRISDALRQRLNSRSRESERDDRGSYIVQQLEDQLKSHLRNPEPALLTEYGVRLVEDKFGNKVPLKLLKFIKDDSVYGKGSVNYGSAADGYQNGNIAYLSDRFQIQNYISKQREDKATTKKKSYSNLQSEKLWPKQAKFDKKSIGSQLLINEKKRAQQEAEALKHSLNYTAIKHHPRNLNFRSGAEKEASPKWGSPRDSVKTREKTRLSNDFSPIQPKPAVTERLKTTKAADSQQSTTRTYIKDRMALIKQAIEADETTPN